MTDVDVLIVGAGLSGIGAACHLQHRLPGATYAILEARDAIGGTWDLFRYPGVRSDSDMATLGYAFRPWPERETFADGPSILAYVRETAREHGVDAHIRFGRRAVGAAWSSADARWTVQTEAGEAFRCRFLLLCTGYYRYDAGYTPELPGIERFGGPVVHPQRWPEDLEWAGRRVLVVGSGATAVTLVPALARDAAHVTMLQRSPTYVVPLPEVDPFAAVARRVLPPRRAYHAVRWKNILVGAVFYQLSRRRPRVARAMIRRWNRRALPDGFDLRHFTPSYDPWDQRICAAPQGDLFAALAGGSASVVTDTIETFDAGGVRLASGGRLDADVVVTATGLRMLAMGGIALSVDGEDVRLPERLAYKACMLSDVPNLALVVGYTNASWTLKAELTCRYVCRLLAHLDATGTDYCVARDREPGRETLPLMDFSSGYVQRDIHRFPRQGTEMPWRVHQNYLLDRRMFGRGELEDGALEFCQASARGRPVGASAAAGADAR